MCMMNVFSSIAEMKKICRCCLSRHDIVVDIYSKTSVSEYTYCDVVMECAPIQISAEDGLPSFICRACAAFLDSLVTFLDSLVAFRTKCAVSDSTLRNIYASLKEHEHDSQPLEIKTEPDENLGTVSVDVKPNIEDISSERNRNVQLYTLRSSVIVKNDFDDVEKMERKVEKPKKFKNPKKRVRPKKYRDDPPSTQCNTCGNTYKTLEKLKQHIRYHKAKLRYKCDLCDKTFMHRNRFIVHKRLHTEKLIKKSNRHAYVHTRNKKPFECDLCDKSFIQNTSLLVHRRIHTGEKPFACDTCGKRFKSNEESNRHAYVHTGDKKPFKCYLCDKSFVQKTNLVVHRRIHTGEKPFACDVCGRRFKSIEESNRHAYAHIHDKKPFECDLCDKSFLRNSNLIAHRRIHTGKKPFTCTMCPKLFNTKHSLNIHTYKHTGEKPPHECPLCFTSFVHKLRLRKHMQQRHAKSKMFECVSCRRSFIYKGNLNAHIAMHCRDAVPVPPATCDMCGQTFKTKQDLKDHAYIHGGEKRPYKCDLCDKSFAQRNYRESHRRWHLLTKRNGQNHKTKNDPSTEKRVQKEHMEVDVDIDVDVTMNLEDIRKILGIEDSNNYHKGESDSLSAED